MPRENHGVTVGAMQILAKAVTPEDMAKNSTLAHANAKLLEYVDEIQRLVLERDALEARKQEATTRINEILVEGSRQHTLVEAMLKVLHGPSSEKLVAYRIQPFRGRKRRRQAEEASGTADVPGPGAP
jgi:hypothetical protein